MANIKEIAKAAGVSTSTVSRVLNNNQLISPETREHVLRVMREYNYVPNAMARGLSNRKASTITLLVNNENTESFDNLFFHKIMYGIESVLYKSDLFLMISNFQDTRLGKDRLIRMVQGKLTQGIIVPAFLLTQDLLKTLENLNVPFVVLGEPANTAVGFDWVDINNTQGGQIAVQHLLAAGYRRIAFLSGSTAAIFNRNRLAGYRSMLAQSGMPVDETLIATCDSTKDDAFAAMSALLGLPNPPDAVLCGDNVIGMGAMKAIQKKGYRIPETFGLVSFDNLPIAELVEPPMTTVVVDVFEMGAETAKLLLRLMENPNANRQASLITTTIQVRGSSKK